MHEREEVMVQKHSTVVAAFIFSVSAIVVALMLVKAFHHRNRANDLISVTGLEKKNFESDLIVWSGSFIRVERDLKSAYSKIKNDRGIIEKYLTNKGIQSDEIVFSSVDINKEYETIYDKQGQSRSQFTGFKLTQRVQIESKDVNKIEALSREVTELIDSGVEFYSKSPQYYYTKLSELKVKMLAAATANARLRADKIAENSDGKIGKLKYARMGVFQITAQNSSEDYSWGGTFNTSSKFKTAAVTVKLQYELE